MGFWRVTFVRHAISQDRSSWKGPDSQRPLTARGRQVFLAYWQHHWGQWVAPEAQPIWLFHSGYRRSWQTARLIEEILSQKARRTCKLALWPSIRPESDPEVWWKHWWRWVKAQPDPGSVIFVSHNPFLERWWQKVMGKSITISWPKGAALITQWRQNRWELLFFTGPSLGLCFGLKGKSNTP